MVFTCIHDMIHVIGRRKDAAMACVKLAVINMSLIASPLDMSVLEALSGNIAFYTVWLHQCLGEADALHILAETMSLPAIPW